jgi:hypothetical protein
MEKKTPYFSHDMNAHDDQKIQTLITLYRFQGYGWFWYLLEMMGIEENYKLEESEFFYCSLARRFLTTEKFAKKFIDDCVKIKLFQRSEGYLYSSSFLDRMRIRDLKVLKCRESGSIGGKVSSERSSVTEANAQAIKLNEIKLNKEEKKSIKKKFLDNVFLAAEEYQKLIEHFGTEDAAKERIENFSVQMKIHGYKYQDHYLTILAWDRREKKQNPDAAKKERPRILTATYDPYKEEA